jgi:hypothetical protein
VWVLPLSNLVSHEEFPMKNNNQSNYVLYMSYPGEKRKKKKKTRQQEAEVRELTLELKLSQCLSVLMFGKGLGYLKDE